MRTIRNFIGFWDNFESVVGGLFLTFAGVIIVIEVCLRSFFGTSIIGSDELACFAVIWSVFFTASVGMKKDIHVRIDLFLNFVPKNIRRVCLAVGQVAVTLFSAYLTYSGILLVHEALLIGDRTVGSLETPLWIPQLIMPIGGFLLFLRSLGKIHELATKPLTEEARHDLEAL